MFDTFYTQVVIEKMKEREISNFMGRVLIELLRLKKEKADENFQLNVFKDLEGFAEKLDEDFYLKGRILSQEEFWKTELKYFQSLKSETESQGDPVRFVAELITRYLK